MISTQKVVDLIYEKVNELDEAKKHLKERAEARFNCPANYEKEFGKVVISLINGVEFKIDGEAIKNPSVTLTDKIARGICWEKKLEADKSETLFKVLLEYIATTKAQLNGLQSILKNQDEV